MKMTSTAFTAAGVLLSTGGALAVPASPGTIDFSGYDTGEIISGQVMPGVHLSVDNLNADTDLGVVFDTSSPSSRDNDLVGPAWDGGNLAQSQAHLGNALIIQEMDGDFAGYTNGAKTHVNIPDDEGLRPAGSIYFTFDFLIDSFALDLIDVEGPEEYGDTSGYVMVFMGQDQLRSGAVSRTVSFAEFINPSSAFYDPTVSFGNNHANRIRPITADQLDLFGFDRVEVSLGGSGAIDNVTYQPADNLPVPEPGSLALLGLSGLALLRRRR